MVIAPGLMWSQVIFAFMSLFLQKRILKTIFCNCIGIKINVIQPGFIIYSLLWCLFSSGSHRHENGNIASWAPDAIPHPCWRSWPSQPVYPFSPALIPMAVKYFLQSAGQEHLYLDPPGDTQRVRDLQIPRRPPICIFNLVSSDAYEWLRATAQSCQCLFT